MTSKHVAHVVEDVRQAFGHESEVSSFSPNQQEEGSVENLSLRNLLRSVGQAAHTAREAS